MSRPCPSGGDALRFFYAPVITLQRMTEPRAAYIVRVWTHICDDGSVEPRGEVLSITHAGPARSFRTWSGLLEALRVLQPLDTPPLLADAEAHGTTEEDLS
jgi:hypothetical protein